MKHRWFRAEMPATPVILAVREDGLRRALGIGCREWSESEASLTMGQHLREWRERRVAALRDSHPFLFCTWPFNPRLPRLLPSQPSRLGLTYREAAERLQAVFVAAGAPEEATVSNELANHMARLYFLVDYKHSEDYVRAKEIDARQRVIDEWNSRMRHVELWRPSKWDLREWQKWALENEERKREEIEFRAADAVHPDRGWPERVVAARREEAAIKLQRAVARWMYQPGGPMMWRGVVDEGWLAPAEFEDVEFEDVDDYDALVV